MLKVRRWVLRHQSRPVLVVCHLRLVKFKSALCLQHSKQASSEMLHNHSFIAVTILVKQLQKVSYVIYINYTTLSVMLSDITYESH